MSRTYLRGDLYYADLGYGIGSEQKGTRPVIIIQNNVGNKYGPVDKVQYMREQKSRDFSQSMKKMP